MEQHAPSDGQGSAGEEAGGNVEQPELDENDDGWDDTLHGRLGTDAKESAVAVGKKPSKTVSQRAAAKGKKPGNPGIFTGEPLAFLKELLPQFVATRSGSRHGKNLRFRTFWTTTLTSFWEKFDWTMFKKSNQDKSTVLARINNVSIQISLQQESNSRSLQSIHAWFPYHARTAGIDVANPWLPVLRALRKPDSPAPKRHPAWQVWQKEHKDEVAKAAGAGASLGARVKEAVKLFEGKDAETRKQYEEKARRMYDEAIKGHEDALTGLPAPDEEGRKM